MLLAFRLVQEHLKSSLVQRLWDSLPQHFSVSVVSFLTVCLLCPPTHLRILRRAAAVWASLFAIFKIPSHSTQSEIAPGIFASPEPAWATPFPYLAHLGIKSCRFSFMMLLTPRAVQANEESIPPWKLFSSPSFYWRIDPTFLEPHYNPCILLACVCVSVEVWNLEKLLLA